MRVAIDARLVTYQRAGIGNYILSLLGALARSGSDAQILVLTSRKPYELSRELDGHTIRRLWTPPHHRFEQLALAAEIASLSVDVYHAPDFIPPFLRRFPAVITVHDLAFLRWPDLLTPDSRRYYGQIGRAVRNAQRIIAVSQCTRRDLIELVGAPPHRIDVVYEAADPMYGPSSDQDVSRSRARFGIEGAYFLFVGTLEPRKNLARLLAAYARIACQPGSPELVLVGRRGWLSDDPSAQAHELGIAERVRWLGGLPSEDLPALFTGALAFAFPSLYEGFGLPALEAMACGAPVVAGTGGALPEVVADAALLVDPFDVAGIASALERVWRNEELRTHLRSRGFERVGEFGWDRAAAETLDVYRRAA